MDELSQQDLEESRQLLEELYKEVALKLGYMGEGQPTNLGLEELKSLREIKIEFGDPYDQLQQLTPALFEAMNLPLTPIQKEQLAGRYEFYYMTLTLPIRAPLGVGIKQLTCKLQFEAGEGRDPTVQSMFPPGEWREVLEIGGALKLEVDANVGWKLVLDSAAGSRLEEAGLPTADIHTANTANSYIIVPHFSFPFGRAELKALGEGSPTCSWEFAKTKVKDHQTCTFIVVFKVLTGTTEVKLTGTAWADPSFQWLSHLEQVASELQRRFLELLQGKKPLPLGIRQSWLLTLPRQTPTA